ncbi:phosphotransferase system eiic [Actinomyces glycerinitolerans]|uniref:Phosphotransferase system eiic n=1 Tax=Actinomyces glycerinitolerans TaxID=1892869 RepID=A0A1M4RXX5_9ACTO|nr:phosphotransferase system eiic [Actinomyces glycerinitolerans]
MVAAGSPAPSLTISGAGLALEAPVRTRSRTSLNLALIFAVGVAIGFARKSDGSTAIAGLFGYLVLQGVFGALAPYWGAGGETPAENTINYGVLGGIVIGIVAARLWQRYYRIKLPDWLAFFGGRRFVPIITSVAAIGVALVMGPCIPPSTGSSTSNWAAG